MGCLNALLAGRLARNESYDAPFGIPCRLLTPYLLDDDDNDVSDTWLIVVVAVAPRSPCAPPPRRRPDRFPTLRHISRRFNHARSAALASTPFPTFARHVVRLNPKSHPRIDPSSSSSSSSSLGVPLSLALVPSARPAAAPADGANLDRARAHRRRRSPSSPPRRRADALDDDDDDASRPPRRRPPPSTSSNAHPSRALPKHAENIARRCAAERAIGGRS
jgi:hypothetical protein